MLLGKPLIGKDLPQLVALLRRKGLGNNKIAQQKGKNKSLTPFSNGKDDDLLGKGSEEEIHHVQFLEKLHRSSYKPESEVADDEEEAAERRRRISPLKMQRQVSLLHTRRPRKMTIIKRIQFGIR